LDETSQSAQVIDSRPIVNVLTGLQVAIRKVGLYSFSHSVVPSLLENLKTHFNALFESVEGVTFGITRHEFLYQDTTISAGNPVIRELARGLNQFGLAGISFFKGLTKEDILKFLKLLVEGRGLTHEQRERMIDQLHQEVPSIRLKLIRFGDALKGPQDTVDPAKREKPEQQEKELWRGLVGRLLDQSAGTGRSTLSINPEEIVDLEKLAELINRLCHESGPESKNHERTIADYLSALAESPALTSEQRMHLYQELSKLLSTLEPAVREQIFRFSVEETENGKASMEDLLEFFSETQLLEILNQIQLSNQAVSAPMLSLLNKLTDLSVQNEKIKEMLTSKLENHPDLFQELFTNRANRTFYPSSYRSFLDQELVHQQAEKKSSPIPEIKEIEPEAVNHHMALVVLELLDGPIRSQSEYETFIRQATRLLTEGMGDQTHVILQETLVTLFRKLGSADETTRPFLQKEIKNFIKPEVFAGLLQSYRTQGDERVGDLLGQMRELAGAEVIPMFLDLLEGEENLSVRKRLLQLIVQCGPAVIPLAVERLKNPKWYVVRNMVVMLKDLGAKEALPDFVRCLQHDSSKLRMAALQAIESLGKGTDYFYRALTMALRDSDPGVFRKGVSMILSPPDPRAMEMITARLRYSGQTNTDVQLIPVLEMIRKSRVKELLPVLVQLRRQLRLRFWQWNRIGALYKAVNDTVRQLRSGDSHHG
jgi:hypothetical protein